ncbi:MAG: NADH-quinone oxidoreductase subunit C [Candidatus Dormibacteria bacterium]
MTGERSVGQVTDRPAAGARALQVLSTGLADAVLDTREALGEVTIFVSRDCIVAAATLLRDHSDARYRTPLFVTAVDYPDREPETPRFDVVYQLRSLQFNDVCRLVVQVTEADPTVPTLERVFAGMDWLERECYDLLGIVFDGHHDLQRILLPDDWEGHPLRKDYVSFGEPVAFTHNIEWALPSQERPRDMPGESR